jgi:hypothetical protein
MTVLVTVTTTWDAASPIRAREETRVEVAKIIVNFGFVITVSSSVFDLKRSRSVCSLKLVVL